MCMRVRHDSISELLRLSTHLHDTVRETDIEEKGGGQLALFRHLHQT